MSATDDEYVELNDDFIYDDNRCSVCGGNIRSLLLPHFLALESKYGGVVYTTLCEPCGERTLVQDVRVPRSVRDARMSEEPLHRDMDQATREGELLRGAWERQGELARAYIPHGSRLVSGVLTQEQLDRLPDDIYAQLHVYE